MTDDPSPPRRDASFGPVLRGGRPRSGGPDWRLIGVTLMAVVVMLGVGISAAGGALVWTGQRSIAKTSVMGLSAPEASGVEEVDRPLNILVVGSDSREGLTRAQLKQLGTTQEAGGDRTDTIILVRLDPAQDKAMLLSFPRDLLVERCDGSRGRINEAYHIGRTRGIGGPSCLVQTIRLLTDIPIDHFVRVDLAGFIKVVDVVGGVSMYLDEPLKDRHAGLDLPAGCVTLDGARAVGFVRARYIDSDFGRIARQQRFIRELVAEATSLDVLLQPGKLFQVVRSVGQTLETDRAFGLAQMRRVAFTFRGLGVEDLQAWTVPVHDDESRGAYYAEIERRQAEALFSRFRGGASGSRFAAPASGLAPADVPPLRVQNGAGVAGAATAAQRALVERGFAVAPAGNAARFNYAETMVFYPPDRQQEAALVAGALGGVPLINGSAGQPITVVVGRDFSSLTLSPATAGTSDPSDTAVEPGNFKGVWGAPDAPLTPAAPQGVAGSKFKGAEDSPVSC